MRRRKKNQGENPNQKRGTNLKSFYLVTSLQDNSVPLSQLMRYPNRRAATKRAKEIQGQRVAKMANPRDFYILRAVAAVRPTDVEFVQNLREPTISNDPRVPLTEEQSERLLQIIGQIPATEVRELFSLLGWKMAISWKQDGQEYNIDV